MEAERPREGRAHDDGGPHHPARGWPELEGTWVLHAHSGATHMRPISGLGPHGEFAASADELRLSDASMALARAGRYAVGVVLHTTESDWSRLQLAGIRTALERFGARLVEVVDCGFRPEHQAAAVQAMLERHPDGIISIPMDTSQAAAAHRRVAEAGVRLVLMDNSPPGMVANKDYTSVVSADNFGNGEIAAEILAAHIRHGGTVGVVGYGVDFPVTNERELGFRRWLSERRPDIIIERLAFGHPQDAGVVVRDRLGSHLRIDGLFVVWDEPALSVVRTLEAAGRDLPVTTVDLGRGVALEVARGGLVKGLGAQLPFDQGVAEATALVMALAGEVPPPWIALPALGVTRRNILEAYEAVWHAQPPDELREAFRTGDTPA